jgi:hypothetical protein
MAHIVIPAGAESERLSPPVGRADWIFIEKNPTSQIWIGYTYF